MTRSTRFWKLPAACAAALLLTAVSGRDSAAATLARPDDPVVLTGADVAALLGSAPADVVAFRWEAGWVQIPVQVDERAVVAFAQIYDNLGSISTSVTSLVYTDATTYTGADPDTTLDGDDEIVFMAADAGDVPPAFSEPPGVLPNSGVQIRIRDPLDGGTGTVFLFERSGGLDPGAGANYADYSFDLLSGSYLTSYNLATGPNPENSTLTTPHYSLHFSDRWTVDEMKVLVGASTGVDILDRRKHLFAPGVCSRSEDTFAAAEGAFIVNKNGPVRGLRSLLGANSGPLTQKTLYFYARREDTVIDLRVHLIPGVMDFFDYSPAAAGMTYRNILNPAGVTIDGAPDVVTAGAHSWELVTGPQGSIVSVGRFDADVPLPQTSFYEDDAVTPSTQCTGDPDAYGSSGLWVDGSIPNTDPTNPPFNVFRGRRTLYYAGPGTTGADAAQRAAFVDQPLEATVVHFYGVPAAPAWTIALLAAALLAAARERRGSFRSKPELPRHRS